jgi:hypothetical protein
MLLCGEYGPFHNGLWSVITTHTIDRNFHRECYLTGANLWSAARSLAVPLRFAPSDDLSRLIIATALAYPVGQFVRAALRARTQAADGQTMMCAPFVAA